MSKRALVIGINYENDPSHRLMGCQNDANMIEEMLVGSLGYPKSSVIKLLEGAATRGGILAALDREVTTACRSKVAELWISFSGHGLGLRDTSGDEEDGRDEAIVPYDHGSAGFITDDVIWSYLSRVPAVTRVIMVFDSCHSGTMADLKYTYVAGIKATTESARARPLAAHVVQISGCRDDQTSADAYIDNRFSGAMTAALLSSLRDSGFDLTFFKLLTELHRRLEQGGFEQRPQITSSRPLSCTSIFCSTADKRPVLVH